jgi:hypothetical protein
MRQGVAYLRILIFACVILAISDTAFAGVPIPWGAKLIREDTAVVGGGEERHIVSYQTKASKEELFKYYLKEMPLRGYSLFMNGEQNMIFTKGEEMVVIVVPPPMDSKTSFMITTASTKRAEGQGNPYSTEAKCEPIPSVPVYPGATCVNSTRLKSGASSSAAYSTEDSGGAVLDFYRAQMPRYDWKLEKEIDIEEVMLRAMRDERTVAMTPEQKKAIHDFYGDAQGVFFINQKGNGCSIQVMNNPAVKGGSLVNIIYEDKAQEK